MKLLDALQWRYAVKQFSDYKLDSTEVRALLDAARLTPSAYGLQPYSIIVIESPSIRQRLIPHSFGQDKVLNSSHLVIIAAQTQLGDQTVDRYIAKNSEVTGVPLDELSDFSNYLKSALGAMTTEQKQEWAHQQAYIALGNLVTSAALMGIDSCPMTGFEREGFDMVLGLKDKGLTTTVICPIGRRASDDKNAKRPKVRFDYDEIVMAL